jgi:hypothetical protein
MLFNNNQIHKTNIKQSSSKAALDDAYTLRHGSVSHHDVHPSRCLPHEKHPFKPD